MQYPQTLCSAPKAFFQIDIIKYYYQVCHLSFKFYRLAIQDKVLLLLYLATNQKISESARCPVGCKLFHQELYQKAAFLKISKNFPRNFCCEVLFRKKGLHYRCFVISIKIFRTAILQNTCKQQLPKIKGFTQAADKSHGYFTSRGCQEYHI